MSRRYVLRSEDGADAIAVEGVRRGSDGRLVVRVVRLLPNHSDYDPRKDAEAARLLSAFVVWLEAPSGEATQVVRLSAPRGAELLDVGKWAIEYAPVDEWAASDQPEAGVLTPSVGRMP